MIKVFIHNNYAISQTDLFSIFKENLNLECVILFVDMLFVANLYGTFYIKTHFKFTLNL